jgi:hypothetical protein
MSPLRSEPAEARVEHEDAAEAVDHAATTKEDAHGCQPGFGGVCSNGSFA